MRYLIEEFLKYVDIISPPSDPRFEKAYTLGQLSEYIDTFLIDLKEREKKK